jgi:hypothetical protein
MKYAGGKLHIAVFNKKSWGGPLGEFVNLSSSFILSDDGLYHAPVDQATILLPGADILLNLYYILD